MGIRILHVLDKISVDSGVSSVVMNYYAKLQHNRVTFDFMLNEDTDTKTKEYILSKGSKIYLMPRLKVTNTICYIKSLKEFYQNNDYQIIHGHVANSAVFYLGLAKNVPHRIIHSHNTRSSDIFWKRIRNWFLTRFLKHLANHYMACSNEAATFLFGSTDNVTILNNPIDIERFIFDKEKRKEIRTSLGLKDEILIGHVGRFSPQKNHNFLIEVFNELHKRNINTRLLLIGHGELYSDIVRKIKQLGLQEAVIFLGKTNDVGAYMSAMDVFVLPSLFEGLGIVGVEAQASGLQIFASEHVPRMMDVTNTVNFLKLDKTLWLHKLSTLQISHHNRREMGEKVMGSRFDIKTQVENLYNYYEQLLNN